MLKINLQLFKKITDEEGNTVDTTEEKKSAGFNEKIYDDSSKYSTKQDAMNAFNAGVMGQLTQDDQGNWYNSKGNKVTVGYDANGGMHYSVKGDEGLQDILDYYNGGNASYNVGGLNYQWDEGPKYSDFSYDPAPVFNDEWEQLKEALAKSALNMNFTDYLGSDDYAALANQYSLMGNKSMQDTLGQASARTGGLASTYATAASQQQYNDYMSRLQDVARAQFESEQAMAMEKAAAAYGYSDNDYNRYLTDLAQYNTDRDFAYQVLSDTIAQSNYDQEWANTLAQQSQAQNNYLNERTYNRDIYADETQYNRGIYADETAYNRALTTAEASGNFDKLSSFGWTKSEIKDAESLWKMNNLAVGGTGGSGGSGGGSRRSYSYTPSSTPEQPKEEKSTYKPSDTVMRAINDIDQNITYMDANARKTMFENIAKTGKYGGNALKSDDIDYILTYFGM